MYYRMSVDVRCEMARITTDQMFELLEQDRTGRVTRELLREFLKNPSRFITASTLDAKESEAATVSSGQPMASEWKKFFGHLWVLDDGFNETNYPLGVDPGDEAEEFGFNQVVSGYRALAEFEHINCQGASLWAQGRYIQTHPEAQKEHHPLLGIGAQWQVRDGDVCFPVFSCYGGKPSVDLGSLVGGYSSDYRFLLRKEKGI